VTLHPSGAEDALALAGLALFSWAAAAIVFVVSTVGSIVAGAQLRRRTGSTVNLLLSSLFLGVSALWAVIMIVLFFSTMKTIHLEAVMFLIGPGTLMTIFSLSWFALALAARLRRLTSPPKTV
jgi:hypothetical protein